MPLVSSPDDADAETAIGFLGIKIDSSYEKASNPMKPAGLYGIDWRSGRRSMVRQVAAMVSRGEGSLPTKEEDSSAFSKVGFKHPWALVTGNGGGRWYNFHVMERVSSMLPGYRHLLVDGTSEAFSIYHLHAQHAYPEFQCELREARNVSIYGCKQEVEKVSFMKIKDCSDIRIFGLAGWAMPRPGDSNFLIENSHDFLIAGYAPYQEYRKPTVSKKDPWVDYPCGRTNIKDFLPIVERLADGTEIKVPAFDVPLLYIRGNPHENTRN